MNDELDKLFDALNNALRVVAYAAIFGIAAAVFVISMLD